MARCGARTRRGAWLRHPWRLLAPLLLLLLLAPTPAGALLPGVVAELDTPAVRVLNSSWRGQSCRISRSGARGRAEPRAGAGGRRAERGRSDAGPGGRAVCARAGPRAPGRLTGVVAPPRRGHIARSQFGARRQAVSRPKSSRAAPPCVTRPTASPAPRAAAPADAPGARDVAAATEPDPAVLAWLRCSGLAHLAPAFAAQRMDEVALRALARLVSAAADGGGRAAAADAFAALGAGLVGDALRLRAALAAYADAKEPPTAPLAAATIAPTIVSGAAVTSGGELSFVDGGGERAAAGAHSARSGASAAPLVSRESASSSRRLPPAPNAPPPTVAVPTTEARIAAPHAEGGGGFPQSATAIGSKEPPGPSQGTAVVAAPGSVTAGKFPAGAVVAAPAAVPTAAASIPATASPAPSSARVSDASVATASAPAATVAPAAAATSVSATAATTRDAPRTAALDARVASPPRGGRARGGARAMSTGAAPVSPTTATATQTTPRVEVDAAPVDSARAGIRGDAAQAPGDAVVSSATDTGDFGVGAPSPRAVAGTPAVAASEAPVPADDAAGAAAGASPTAAPVVPALPLSGLPLSEDEHASGPGAPGGCDSARSDGSEDRDAGAFSAALVALRGGPQAAAHGTSPVNASLPTPAAAIGVEVSAAAREEAAPTPKTTRADTSGSADTVARASVAEEPSAASQLLPCATMSSTATAAAVYATTCDAGSTVPPVSTALSSVPDSSGVPHDSASAAFTGARDVASVAHAAAAAGEPVSEESTARGAASACSAPTGGAISAHEGAWHVDSADPVDGAASAEHPAAGTSAPVGLAADGGAQDDAAAAPGIALASPVSTAVQERSTREEAGARGDDTAVVDGAALVSALFVAVEGAATRYRSSK